MGKYIKRKFFEMLNGTKREVLKMDKKVTLVLVAVLVGLVVFLDFCGGCYG